MLSTWHRAKSIEIVQQTLRILHLAVLWDSAVILTCMYVCVCISESNLHRCLENIDICAPIARSSTESHSPGLALSMCVAYKFCRWLGWASLANSHWLTRKMVTKAPHAKLSFIPN